MRATYVAVWLVVGVSSWGQSETRKVPSPAPSHEMAGQSKTSQDQPIPDSAAAEKQDDIPAYSLEFQVQEKPSGDVAASPFIVLPVRCASDGTLFLNMINPPSAGNKSYDPLQQTVFSVSPKGTNSFSIHAASDLDDVRFIAMDADDSKVAFLVVARRKDQENISSASLSPGVTVRKKSYIALFDRNGSYKKSVEVGVDYGPSDLAILPSGEFVVFGYDSVNSAVRVSLLGSSGELIRSIPLSDDMVSNPALKEAETGSMHERVQALSRSGIGSWRFARARGKALLYQPGSGALVLEIGEGGAKREVPLTVPQGYSLDAFLPASDLWIARYKRNDLLKSGEFDANPVSKDLQLYELNPGDGSLRYRMDLGIDNAVGIFGIACEGDGEFISYRMDKNSKLVLLKATAPR